MTHIEPVTPDEADLTAELDDERSKFIERCRSDLTDRLSTAGRAVANAQRGLDELTSSAVYDVEYAEGTQGEDIAHHLSNAARSLRAAAALTEQANNR